MSHNLKIHGVTLCLCFVLSACNNTSSSNTGNTTENDINNSVYQDTQNKYPQTINDYVPNHTYLVGDKVIFNGAFFTAQLNNQGIKPDELVGSGIWLKIEEGGNDVSSEDETNLGNDSNDSTHDSTQTGTSDNSDDTNTTDTTDFNGHINNDGQYTVTMEQLKAKEKSLTSSELMQTVMASIATTGNQLVDSVFANAAHNPENVKRVENIISDSDWEFLFPKRAPEYTYENFLKAVAKFPAFCGNYEDGRDAYTICSKSLATMFAHFAQETGGHSAYWDVPEWRQALVHAREMGWDEEMRGGYNGECNVDVWQGQTWPCGFFDDGEFKSYFGRGAKQLSYNYNYGPFSEAMFGDVSILMNNPELVADTWLNLASAIFFFIYPQPPKPSMLHVIDGTWQPNERDISNGLMAGFGVSIQIINGGVECGGSTEIQQGINRIDYYQNFANYLQVPVPNDEVLGCAGMKQFDAQGSGALEIYWEQDWAYSSTTADGKVNACQLVGYQTPFSVFKEGDYASCVKYFFEDVVITQ